MEVLVRPLPPTPAGARCHGDGNVNSTGDSAPSGNSAGDTDSHGAGSCCVSKEISAGSDSSSNSSSSSNGKMGSPRARHVNGLTPKMGEGFPSQPTWNRLPPANGGSDVGMQLSFRNSSPDSACETDILSGDLMGSSSLFVITGTNESIARSSPAEDKEMKTPRNLQLVSPPQSGYGVTTTITNGLSPWQQDSDGDSGITNFGERLGSTSSSEAEHSSSGFPDVYLARLQAKHLNRTTARTVHLGTGSGIGPVRGDHSIPLAIRNNEISSHPSSSVSSVRATTDQNDRILQLQNASILGSSNPNISRIKRNAHQNQAPNKSLFVMPLVNPQTTNADEWLHQRSYSATEFRSSRNVSVNPRRSVRDLTTRPVSLDGEQMHNRDFSQQRCSSAVNFSKKCPTGNFDSSKKPSLSVFANETPNGQIQTVLQGKSALYVNVYENMSSSDGEDSVFHSEDMIKVHARPVSVIPASPRPPPTTPRQAKSADASTRRRRLQKAFSLACVVNYDDFISVHARVVSVIPDKHETETQQRLNPLALPPKQATNQAKPPPSRQERPVTALGEPYSQQRMPRTAYMGGHPNKGPSISHPHLLMRPRTSLGLPISQDNHSVHQHYVPDHSRILNHPPITACLIRSGTSKSQELQSNGAKDVVDVCHRDNQNSIRQLQPSSRSHQSAANFSLPPTEGTTLNEAVGYAKVNKALKSEKPRKGKSLITETVLDESEPPLPPRNYRSESSSKLTRGSCSRSSLAERVHDLTRTAREALRKAFSLEWLNEKDGGVSNPHGGSRRKSARQPKNGSIPGSCGGVKTTPSAATQSKRVGKKPPLQTLATTKVPVVIMDQTCANYTEI